MESCTLKGKSSRLFVPWSRTQRISKLPQWWYGPSWLRQSESSWPAATNLAVEPPEAKNKVITLISTVSQPLVNLSRYSQYDKLLRVTAYAVRFCFNIRKKPTERNLHQLSCSELQRAMIYLVKVVQQEAFSEDIQCLKHQKELKPKSRLLALSPFLDNQSVLRVGGRLANSSLSYNQKFPILLPQESHLSWLIAVNEHISHLHAGPKLLHASLRQRFWPLRGQQLVKKVVQKYFRANPKAANQLMGNLPRQRVEPVRPFLRTGIDYCSPIVIRGTSRKMRKVQLEKAYIAIFVCLATRAVHIELVTDLTTNAFLDTLKRFFARRSVAQELHSDNATMFVGAMRELRQLLKSPQFSEKIHPYLAARGIEWKFIPLRAPHFGGIWEAAVKSCKVHLKKIVGQASLTYEEMSTCLAQIKACLNSRPISPLSADPNDTSFLSPGHFLIGEHLTSLPKRDLTAIECTRLQRWQRVQQLSNRKWRMEYLSQLQNRYKWQRSRPNLKIGDLVLIKEEGTPPLQWKAARVLQLHPGRDERARVATLKVPQGILKRAIHSFCPLPLNEEPMPSHDH